MLLLWLIAVVVVGVGVVVAVVLVVVITVVVLVVVAIVVVGGVVVRVDDLECIDVTGYWIEVVRRDPSAFGPEYPLNLAQTMLRVKVRRWWKWWWW